MRIRTPLLAVAAGLVLALAPAADAATPFTAGTGQGQDVAVGSDGTGHVVWVTDEAAGDRVGYCRVPAGGSDCDSESGFLSFPLGGPPQSPSPHAQVFTPAPGKVVILASCHNCTGIAERTYRFISTDNGANFTSIQQVGNIALNGQSAFWNAANVGLGVAASSFQGLDDPEPGSTMTVTLGQSPLFVYDATVALLTDGSKAVYAVNDLDTVRYRVFTNPPMPAGLSAGELNGSGNWSASPLLLPGAEGNNDETHVSSGPNGIYLTYRFGTPTENRIGLRNFDSASGTFGGASYIEGADPIEDNGIGLSNHSQDASGRLHAVWRSLHDSGRLRYTHSDTTGTNFTAPANLATRETFLDPVVEAGPDGNGFAVWRGSGSSIRVVRIDPQPEPGGGPGPGGGEPDSTPPVVGSPRIGDSTLTPGQGTTFTFTSSEAGVATLTVQKQVKGLRVRVRGKRRCVPQTRKRLRALRRRAGSLAAYRRLLRRSRCRAYKRIGSIRQNVVPGQNTIVFSGRIAGRRLRPGRYRALLVIRDTAGNVSRVERIRFRVLRPRRP